MRKIKVLHVLTVLDRGGLETMLMNYFRNFDRESFDFQFLVHRNKGHYEKEILDNDGVIHRVSPLSFSLRNFLKYQKELDAFFKKNQFDIVHVHNNSFGYFPLKYAKNNGVKVRIIHSHISSLKDDSRKVMLGKFLNKKIPKVANIRYACGIDAGKWIFGKLDFEVIPNAINSKKFQFKTEISAEMRKNLNAENSINFVNIGRFNTQKNHLFLLDIFKELVNIKPNSKLYLVGEGDLREKILEKIKKLELQNHVFLLGIREDIADILQAMDVFLFPSLFEGLPVSLVEAQSSGIKCVISDGISAEAILVNENVTVVSLKESPKIWAKKISEIDVSQRKDVSHIIKEKGYDIKENAKKLEQKYIELLEKFSNTK